MSTREEAGNDFVLPGTDSYLHPEETYFNCLHEHDVARAIFVVSASD